MAETVVRIWKAPEGSEARYITVDSAGRLIRCYAKLSDIRKFYAVQIELGHVELKRELDKTYKRLP